MTTARNILKRIRHIPKNPLVIEDPVDIRIAEARARMNMYEEYDGQVAIIRDRNLKLAQEARQKNIEERAAETMRQEEIAEQRLKNLSKARKVLGKMRQNES